MNQTQIDYLYQAFPTPSERGNAAGRSEDGTAGFGVHLRQATASVFDVVRPLQRESASSGTSSGSEDASGPRADDSASRGSLSGSDRNLPAVGDAAADSPASATCAANGAACESDESERDKDQTDGAEVNELAAAGTGQGTNGAAAEAEPEKSAAGAVEDATVAQGTGNAASMESAQVLNASLEVAADGETTTSTSAGPAAQADANAGATAEEINRSAPERQGARHFDGSQTQSAGAVKDVNAVAEQPSDENGVHAHLTTKTTQASAEARTTAEVAGDKKGKVQRGAAGRESADDESVAADAKPGRATAPSDAAGSANKQVTTAVANAVAGAVADAAAVGQDAKADGDARPARRAKGETAIGPLGRALRGTTEAARGGRGANAGEAPNVDPTRFVGRVAKAFQAAHERGGTIQLRLSPPELGALRIQLNVHEGVMSATLEADNATARKLLLDHLPALRDRLAEQNIRVERFEVGVRPENDGSSNPRGSNHNAHQQHSNQSEPRRSNGSPRHTSEAARPEVKTVAPRISSTEINLVV